MTDEEIIEFASEFREGILNGRPSALHCAMVCWPLATLLGLNGVECHSRESEVDLGDYTMNHIWIELADGRALDPTADQFGKLPPVYLGERTEIHQ
jgi:hypothetical protein